MKSDIAFRFINIRPPIRSTPDPRSIISRQEVQGVEEVEIDIGDPAEPSDPDVLSSIQWDSSPESDSSDGNAGSIADTRVDVEAKNLNEEFTVAQTEVSNAAGALNALLQAIEAIRTTLDRLSDLDDRDCNATRARLRASFLRHYARVMPNAVRIQETKAFVSLPYQNQLIGLYQHWTSNLITTGTTGTGTGQQSLPTRLVIDEVKLMMVLSLAKIHGLALSPELPIFAYRVQNFDNLVIQIETIPSRGPWILHETETVPAAGAHPAVQQRTNIRDEIDAIREKLSILDDALQTIYGVFAQVVEEKIQAAAEVPNDEIHETITRIPLARINSKAKALISHHFMKDAEVTMPDLIDTFRQEQKKHYERLHRLTMQTQHRTIMGHRQ